MRIKAIIFDVDGVIYDTDKYHYLAWKTIADQEGIFFNEEINNKTKGVSRAEALDILLAGSNKKYNINKKKELMAQKNKLYLAYLDLLNPRLLNPDLKSTLDYLTFHKIPLAIGSSSKNAKRVLDKLNITHYFCVIVDGNLIQKAKPSPEIFETTAKLLSIPNNDCLVIEDSILGIQAAHNANMLAASYYGTARTSREADIDLDNFRDIKKLITEKNWS